MYCDGCEAFGHLTYADTCPIVQQEQTLIIFMDSKGSTPSKGNRKMKSKQLITDYIRKCIISNYSLYIRYNFITC
jgi:hypothetical protein